MSLPPESPFAHRSIAQYGAALRRGELSAQAVTRALLERIEHFNPKLGAYTYVAREEALAAARTVDDLVRAGTDLGPLMGVPLAMKDLFHVDGMPLTAGSRLDVSGIVSCEGSFVRALKRGGAIILGKTWTSEFALGGISLTHRVPWNPVDGQVHRTPGGSSGGSAAAMAAGLCAFATGSDTGGSVRMPAAMCGVFGFKMSRGILPLDGIFPLSPTLDSIGIFTATAADAGTVYAALTGAQHMAAASEKLRLGYPSPRFWDGLHPAVEGALRQARSRLESAGAEIVPFDFPELDEIEPAFGSIVPVELVAILGRERIERGRKVFDPVTWPRLSGALDLRATDYLAALEHLRRLRVLAARHLDAYDAWITPTAPDPASSLAEITTVDDAAAWNKRALRNTRPGNMLDQCGVSLPLRMEGGMPPAGLQILCPAAADARLIALACAIEPIVAEKR